MDRSLIIDTEELDKKDVIIKMGITIIGLVGALLFLLYSNINISVTNTEVANVPNLLIVGQLIIVFVAFLCGYIMWRFTL